MTTPKPKDIDEYIGRYPPETQEILEQIRQPLRKLFLKLKKQLVMGYLLSI